MLLSNRLFSMLLFVLGWLLLLGTTIAQQTNPVSDSLLENKNSAKKLDGKQVALRTDLARTLDFYYGTKINTRDHSPWQIMHWIIAYGVDTPLRIGGPNGKQVTAIGWLCWNQSAGGQRLLYPAENGQLGVHDGSGVEGHPGQFLAILAQSNLKASYPFKVRGKSYTIADLVEHEKATCQAGTELTFKLIGLMHFLKPSVTWKNEYGETWNIERLIKEELTQSVPNAACGGTHRMMGLSFALQARRERGNSIEGQFRRAEKFVNEYHRYTFKLQNSDGSFSTEFFDRPGNSRDKDRRLYTTGHTLEWLTVSLSKNELRDPKMVKAVRSLNDLLWKNREQSWKLGPLGHALRGLRVYDERVFDRHWKSPGYGQRTVKSN